MAIINHDCEINFRKSITIRQSISCSNIYRYPIFSRNLNKRLIKAPKIHFLDSGLLCYLLGITEPQQLVSHPLRGSVFESYVVSEIFKYSYPIGYNIVDFYNIA